MAKSVKNVVVAAAPAKVVNDAVQSAVKSESAAPAADRFAYVSPSLPATVKAFTVFYGAFAGVEAIVKARKDAAKATADGIDVTRAGFNRELWVDADGLAIVVRSKDHTVLNGRTDSPERAAQCYNDGTGAARPIVVARFAKADEAKAQAVAAEIVAFYRAGDADNRLNPLANRFAHVKSPEAIALIALLSSHFDSPQVVGHWAARAAKSAAKVTKTATKGVADAKALLAGEQDKELQAALAKVEAALAAKAAAK